jgi:hypothetical protein
VEDLGVHSVGVQDHQVLGRLFARDPQERLRLLGHGREEVVVHEVDAVVVEVGAEEADVALHGVARLDPRPAPEGPILMRSLPYAGDLVEGDSHEAVVGTARAAVGVRDRHDEDVRAAERIGEARPILPRRSEPVSATRIRFTRPTMPSTSCPCMGPTRKTVGGDPGGRVA